MLTRHTMCASYVTNIDVTYPLVCHDLSSPLFWLRCSSILRLYNKLSLDPSIAQWKLLLQGPHVRWASTDGLHAGFRRHAHMAPAAQPVRQPTGEDSAEAETRTCTPPELPWQYLICLRLVPTGSFDDADFRVVVCTQRQHMVWRGMRA
jgi:hypothetical protein